MLDPQITVSSQRPQASLMGTVENREWSGKPGGGLWTSSDLGEGQSAWTRKASREPGLDADGQIWRLVPSADARICEVSSWEAAKELIERYPTQYEEDPSSRAAGQGLIDWQALSRDYDAVHFVPFGPPRYGAETTRFFWGWDTECTWWASFAFERIELVRPSLSELADSAREVEQDMRFPSL
jgi:hypothetical protein